VKGVDVVTVCRGGGSIEDLWAFNEEVVAHRPVARAGLSAVGHEADVTIADFVADLRAPTPSAAAEIVVNAKDDFYGRIDRLHERLGSAARARIQRTSRHLHMLDARPSVAGFPGKVAMRGRHAAELTHAAARSVRTSLAARDRHLQALGRRLDLFNPGRRLDRIRAGIVAADARLSAAIVDQQHRAVGRFEVAAGRLESLSPLAVLARGYAVCWTGDGRRVVRAASEVQPGDDVRSG
jgi:exodeoxyribonuclease VII large subunit